MQKKILITGASGQIGTVLTQRLRTIHGTENVIASDIKHSINVQEPFVMLDILNIQRFQEVIHDNNISEIYHLAAILSANGEWNPQKTWNVNLRAWLKLLELARVLEINKIFFPSTIAVFGATSQRTYTPQHGSLEPNTVYGISKLSGELWAQYYHQRYGLDVRSLRYPGIIGYQSIPAGGTTDYAVEIFHACLANKVYPCFLESDTTLPMIYMPDAIEATIKLMSAPVNNIKIRTSYNLASMSFSPSEIFASIQKLYPDFKIQYVPDFRQKIAENWTASIDDRAARADWNWMPSYDLDQMVMDMFKKLKN